MRRQVSICAPRCTVREGARGLEPIEKSTQARGAHWSHFWPACRARRCCESPLSIVVFEAARRSASDSSCRSRTIVRRRPGGGGAEPRVEDWLARLAVVQDQDLSFGQQGQMFEDSKHDRLSLAMFSHCRGRCHTKLLTAAVCHAFGSNFSDPKQAAAARLFINLTAASAASVLEAASRCPRTH